MTRNNRRRHDSLGPQRYRPARCILRRLRQSPMMKKLALLLVLSCAPHTADRARLPDRVRWERTAERVSIVRDDWGIAHVRGRSDADAVFGMIYAQAEDDFNR